MWSLAADAHTDTHTRDSDTQDANVQHHTGRHTGCEDDIHPTRLRLPPSLSSHKHWNAEKLTNKGCTKLQMPGSIHSSHDWDCYQIKSAIFGPGSLMPHSKWWILICLLVSASFISHPCHIQRWLSPFSLSMWLQRMPHLSEVGSIRLTTGRLRAAGRRRWYIQTNVFCAI